MRGGLECRPPRTLIEDVRCALATHYLHSTLEFSPSERRRGLCAPLSFFQHRPCGQRGLPWNPPSPSSQAIATYSTAMRTLALVAIEARSTLRLTLVSPPATRKGYFWKVMKLGKWFRSEVCTTSFSQGEQALNAPISHVVKCQTFPGNPLVAYPPNCRLCAAVSAFPHLVNIECVRHAQYHRNNTVLRPAPRLSASTLNPL